MNKQDIKLALTAVIIVLTGICSQVFSQNYCYYDSWNKNADRKWWNYNTPSEYALSSDQIAKINEIRATSTEEVEPLQNELTTLKEQYHAYNTSADADIKKLKSYASQIRILEGKISDINLETQFKIKEILTKEQLTYFNDKGYGWWDMYNCHWRSGRYRTTGAGQKSMRGHRGCCWW